MGQLAESQANTDDKYSKVRQENVGLNQRFGNVTYLVYLGQQVVLRNLYLGQFFKSLSIDFFTQSELIEPVSPKAAQLGIHFFLSQHS